MPKWGAVCFWPKGRRNIRVNGYDYLPEKEPSTGSNENNESQLVTSTVQLIKKEGEALGLIISGGVDKGFRPAITSLRPDSIAFRSDALDVGDVIISVNGIRVHNLKHDEIINMLKNAEGQVSLEIEFPVPAYVFRHNAGCSPRVIQVKLKKENGSFGLTLRGGIHKEWLVVTSIKPGGPADREGTIKVGDRVIAIDNCNLSTCLSQEAFFKLQQITTEALLTVQYDVSVMEVVHKASGPLSVEIEHSSPLQLGITFAQSPDSALIIESIKQGSIIERCGAIHVGDHVLSINNTPCEAMPPAQAMQLLKSSIPDSTIKFEILPVSQMVFRQAAAADTMIKKVSPSNSLHAYSPSPNFNYNWPNSTLPGTHLSRHDTTGVILHPDPEMGFGMTLRPAVGGGWVVGSVEPGGPAARSGVVQPGDRVAQINSRPASVLGPAEVRAALGASSSLSIQLEFDVANTIVPNSGTFQVRLPRTSPNLGLKIAAPKHSERGEPLLISGVQRGSVAYRTGTLRPGDRILAIDNVCPENAEEAESVLHNSNNNVVTLSVLKDDCSPTPIPEDSATINTVELNHNGGQLGITISGTDDPLDPIIVSNLIEGGLAQRMGGIHIGDHLLEVNGFSVHGKTLHEVIELIQASEHSVLLKLFSPVGSSDRANKFATAIPSVDSAVESWGSSALELSLAAGLNGAGARAMGNHTAEANCEEEWENDDMESWAGKSATGQSGDDWSSVMEDLETCGNSQLLRNLESSILGNKTAHNDSYPFPMPVEVHQVTLFKDQVYEDFGFSVSDGLYDKGVYINRIRPGGPADLSNILRPLDRILHVNNTRTYDFDCCLTVPLIAASGDKIELVVSRPAYNVPHQFTKNL